MKISVGICTHNGERYIAEQLNSILAQTVLPDEIVLTDDASSDATVEIAREILSVSGVLYNIVDHKTHQGILKNFSGCLDKCTGDIIFSCDQDDVWMPDKIESFLPYFENGCCFVYSNAIVVDADRHVLRDDFWQCYGVDFASLSTRQFQSIMVTGLCIAGCNMAFTKELYDRIRPIPYHFLHDGWVATCAPLFGKIGFIDKPLIEYRRHGKNVSGFDEKPNENASIEHKRSERKSLIPKHYKTATPDEWFGDQHFYVCNQIFYERMKDYIDEDYAREIVERIRFGEVLLSCLPKHKLRSVKTLIKEYGKGMYKKYRGSEKQLCRDIVYLLVNQNREAEHKKDIW